MANGAGAWNADLDGCVFERNRGDGFFLVFGTIKNCVFRFNGGFGLRFDPDPGLLTLSGSLFYANGEGGLLLREQAVATIDNCTFTRHTGKPAILVTEYNDILFRHCTVADNLILDPNFSSSPCDPTGGAFAVSGCGSRVELQNCLVANNPTSEDPDASGMFGPWIDGGGNVIGGSPKLGPLRNNGGPTLSLLPLPGSPAIDAGLPSDLVVDARGLSRQAGAAPDAGAIEANAQPLADTDSDGIPDIWELFRSMNPSDPGDANSDDDADGQTALAEFNSRTDPGDAQSVHRFVELRRDIIPLLQPFLRRAYLIWSLGLGVAYEVETSTDLHEWRKAPGQVYPAGRQNGCQLLSYAIDMDAPVSFYRVSVKKDQSLD
jgi:hypothetical protein